MKRFILFLLFLGSSFFFYAQKLEKRAQKFAGCVADIGLSEEKYVRQIVGYFDPEMNPDSTAKAHYDWWKQNREMNSYPISYTVLGAEYPSETEGIVRTESVWHYPEGEEVRFLIETQWVRRGRKWYRTPKPQEIIGSEQLK